MPNHIHISLPDRHLVVQFETQPPHSSIMPPEYNQDRFILDYQGTIKIWEVIDTFDEEGTYLPGSVPIGQVAVLETYLEEARSKPPTGDFHYSWFKHPIFEKSLGFIKKVDISNAMYDLYRQGKAEEHTHGIGMLNEILFQISNDKIVLTT